MTETIDKNKELIEILLNTDNRDLAEKVLKELQERGRTPTIGNTASVLFLSFQSEISHLFIEEHSSQRLNISGDPKNCF